LGGNEEEVRLESGKGISENSCCSQGSPFV